MTNAGAPLRTNVLKLSLDYHRTPKDVAIDLCSSTLAQAFCIMPPRGSLALEQMRLYGIDHPEQCLKRLYRTSCRELFRIIARRFHQIDLSPLQGVQIHGPVLYLSYHMGNWEWLGGIFHHLHGDFRPVTRAIHSPRVHRWVQSLRQSVGMNSLVDEAGLRGGRRALEDDAFLAFLADQTPPGASRPGTCLGQALPVSPLPEWWAKGHQFRWLSGFLFPLSPTKYELIVDEFPASEISHWDDILDAYVEPILRQQPHQYFGWWHHRLIHRA